MDPVISFFTFLFLVMCNIESQEEISTAGKQKRLASNESTKH